MYAKSLSLAVAWSMKRILPQDLRALVAAAGLGLPHQDTAPRVGIAFGMVTGTIRHLHRLFGALHRGALGRPALAVLPSLIDQIQWRRQDGGLQHVEFETVRERGEIDLSPWFRNPSVGDFLLSILAAPTRSGGTLHGLDSALQQVGATKLIAKSGTTTTKERKIRDNWVAGAFLGPNQEIMTFVLQIGAPNPNYPLADQGGVSRKTKNRLIQEMIKSHYSDVTVR